MSDLAGAVRGARDDLREILAGLTRLWDHLYDRDLGPPEVKTGKHKRTSSPAPYDPDTQVRRAYEDIVDELSRAHLRLGRDTDVPVHWTRLPSDEWLSRQGAVPLPKWRNPTVPPSEAMRWTRVLDGMLAWLADHGDPTDALTETAGHIASAKGRLADLMPPRRHIPDPRICLHCGERGAERERKWCSACRRAHQRDRGRCGVCGIGMTA